MCWWTTAMTMIINECDLNNFIYIWFRRPAKTTIQIFIVWRIEKIHIDFITFTDKNKSVNCKSLFYDIQCKPRMIEEKTFTRLTLSPSSASSYVPYKIHFFFFFYKKTLKKIDTSKYINCSFKKRSRRNCVILRRKKSDW